VDNSEAQSAKRCTCEVFQSVDGGGVTPSRKTQFFVIFLTILLSTVGFGVCIPVLPLFAEHFQASEFTNGLLIGVFSLMVVIASPLWGRLSDRVGRRPVLIFSILGSAAGYFLMGAAPSLALPLVWLFVARIIDGASGGNVATAQAYIADITTSAERSKAMGMIGAAFGLGFILGPMLGDYLRHISLSAPFYAVGVLCLINAIMVYTSLPESLPPERRHESHTEQPISGLMRHANFPIYLNEACCYFVNLAAFSIMTAIFALYAEKRFQMGIGNLMAVIGVVAVLIQGGLIRRLLPKYGEVPLARFGFASLLLGFIWMPLVNDQVSLYAVSCLLAIGNSLVQPTLNGLASRSVEATWQGRAMGLMQSFGSLGRGIGPILGGWLLSFDRSFLAADGKVAALGYARTPFWAAAALMVGTLILGIKLRTPTVSSAGEPLAKDGNTAAGI